MTQQSSSIQSRNRVRFACAIIGALILFFLSPFFITNSLSAAVVINEVYPKTEHATQNWIELYNNGTESVSLDRWKLQNSQGTVTTFFPNASMSVSPHGFLTFTGSQTGISFSISGDTVRLFDEKNNEIDSQSYPDILGYNTAMGRTSDGGGVWVMCTTPTYDKPNNCPQPTPTPTHLPTNTSTPTPTLLPTKTPTPTPNLIGSGSTPAGARQTFGSFLPSPAQTQVLGVVDFISPTPSSDATILMLKIDKLVALKILLVATACGVIAGVAYILRKTRHRPTV